MERARQAAAGSTQHSVASGKSRRASCLSSSAEHRSLMRRTAVINAVGLTEALLGTATPRLNAFLKKSRLTHITPAFPAVTCTAQSTYLTGQLPARHGIVVALEVAIVLPCGSG